MCSSSGLGSLSRQGTFFQAKVSRPAVFNVLSFMEQRGGDMSRLRKDLKVSRLFTSRHVISLNARVLSRLHRTA